MTLAVDAQFTSLMDDVSADSLSIGSYLEGNAVQRPWMIPSGKTPGWTFDPTDIPDMGDPFDRTDVNQDYIDEFTGAGENKSRIAAGTSIEIGYMAMMERSFRERHRTPTRACMLLSGRRKAHGDAANGVHKGSVEAFIQEMLTT